jgi:hypothetical protein
VVKVIPTKKKTPYPKTPVNPRRKKRPISLRVYFHALPLLDARKTGTKRALAMRNRKNPTVMGGAMATTNLPDTHDPPQKHIAKTRSK